MPVALPDVLSGDGRSIYMRTQRFDLDGKRQGVAPTNVEDQEGEGVHLFSAAGFLEGSWFHRAYFVYGKSIASGAGGWFRAGRYAPAGRLLVLDDSSVYGFGRKPEYFRWSTPLEYHLFATSRKPELIQRAVDNDPDATSDAPRTSRPNRQNRQNRQVNRRDQQNRQNQPDRQLNRQNRNRQNQPGQRNFPNRQRRRQRAGSSAAPPTQLSYRWTRSIPFHVRSMVRAGKTLFVAGPPDLLDEEQAFKQPDDAGVRARLVEQTAAFEGRKGAFLWAVAADDGRTLAEYKLDSPPVWDGLAAARGRLYLSTTAGAVMSMGGE